MKNTCGVVLAAGAGKRMCSCKPKVLSEILFRPMLFWILDSLYASNINKVCVVTGFMNEIVTNAIKNAGYNCEIAIQKEQKGTAHAVITAENFLKQNIEKDVFIVGGDSPFISDEIIFESYKFHKLHENSATIISSCVDNPYGYGRIIRKTTQNFSEICGIIEENDANEKQKIINEINSGAYWFNVRDLLNFVYKIGNNTAQHEYYLTSVIEIFIKNNLKVNAFNTTNTEVVMGANTCRQLANLNEFARQKILDYHTDNGVFIPCPDGIIIGKNVKISDGTAILPNTIIRGNTNIGHNCIIGPNTCISDCKIGDNVTVEYSQCKSSHIEKNKVIGPFETITNLQKICSNEPQISIVPA